MSETAREEQLARSWAGAAVPARHIDTELAEMCQHKSDLWINPDGWSREEIEKYGISIETVKERYLALLQSD